MWVRAWVCTNSSDSESRSLLYFLWKAWLELTLNSSPWVLPCFHHLVPNLHFLSTSHYCKWQMALHSPKRTCKSEVSGVFTYILLIGAALFTERCIIWQRERCKQETNAEKWVCLIFMNYYQSHWKTKAKHLIFTLRKAMYSSTGLDMNLLEE